VTTVPLRTSDELQAAPALATLPALSACIEAFVAALDLAHPCLLSAPGPASEREEAARLLHMHLDACQHLLHQYDHLTFDVTYWYCLDPGDEHQQENDQDDDIPF
jgi:hypothetical protein